MEQQVQRYFEMYGERFTMYSQIQGEFGPVIFKASASISPETFDEAGQNPTPFSCLVCSTSSDDPEFFTFRLQEIAYFLQVFSMFNPQIKKDYGLPQTSQDES